MNQYENEDRRKSDRRVSPALAEFALEERGELLARIAELEEHVKKFIGLTDAFQVLAKVDQSINDRNSRLMKLEQQRGGVALPDRESDVIEDPAGYDEGWNACLDEVARLNPPRNAVAVLPDVETSPVLHSAWLRLTGEHQPSVDDLKRHYIAISEALNDLNPPGECVAVNERAAFAAHVRAEGGLVGWMLGWNGEQYEYQPIQDRWRSWQARALLAQHGKAVGDE